MARRRPAEPTANPARGAALVVVAVVIGLLLLRERSRHLRGHHHQRRRQRQPTSDGALRTATPPTGPRTTRPPPPRSPSPAAGGGAHDRAQRLGDRRAPPAPTATLLASLGYQLTNPEGANEADPNTTSATTAIFFAPRASKARRPRSPTAIGAPDTRARRAAGHAARPDRGRQRGGGPRHRPGQRHADHCHHRRELTRAVGWWTHAPSSAVTPRRPRCSSTSTARSRRSCAAAADARPLPGRGRGPRRAGRALRRSWRWCPGGRRVPRRRTCPDASSCTGSTASRRVIDGSDRAPGPSAGVARRWSTRWPQSAVASIGPAGRRRRAQGPVAHAPLPAPARAGGRRPGVGARGGRAASGSHLRAGEDVGRAAPAGGGRQGHGGRGPGRRPRAVAYVGDDVGDLPAFDALDRLAARGVHAVQVAVRTPEVSDGAPRRRPTSWSTGPEGVARAPPQPAGLLAARRPSWSASQCGRGAGLGERAEQGGARRRARRRASSAPGGARRRCRPRRTGGRAQGRRRCRRSHAPASGDSASTASRSLTSAPFGRHQVEAVADRVHQEHVGPAQQGDRPRVVVLDVEDDRLSSRRCPSAR